MMTAHRREYRLEETPIRHGIKSKWPMHRNPVGLAYYLSLPFRHDAWYPSIHLHLPSTVLRRFEFPPCPPSTPSIHPGPIPISNGTETDEIQEGDEGYAHTRRSISLPSPSPS